MIFSVVSLTLLWGADVSEGIRLLRIEQEHTSH